jgi:uncharacterized protein (TIRG00374 family)
VRRPVRLAAPLRFVLGSGISIVLLAVTLDRVDLPSAGTAIAAAAPGMLLVALAVVLGDLVLRTTRWRVLLGPVSAAGQDPPFRSSMGYLSIGYLANALLPARLGDVARACLAADAFGLGRLTTFGTIVVERAGDGLTMLGLAMVSVLVVGAVGAAGDLVTIGVIGVTLALLGSGAVWLLLVRSRLGASRVGSIIRSTFARIGGGATALRDPRQLARFIGLTLAVTCSALLIAWAVTRSVGLDLAPMEIALFVSAIALSLAIPAAPGAIGTYEFVGVAILSSLGHSPELALATILLMRMLTTLPLIGAGIVSVWALQLRASTLVGSRTLPVES